MPKQLLLTRLCGAKIAIMQGDKLYRLLSEHELAQAGDVYLAKVLRLVPALSLAFLDIGEAHHAILRLNQHATIRQGQLIIVQITRPAHAQKGAHATTAIALSSPYVVYKPHQSGVRVSTKIPKTSAQRLQSHASDVVSALGMTGGLMVRTLAKTVQKEVLAHHIRHHHQLWQTILSDKARTKAPTRLYRMPLLLQALAEHTDVSAIYDDGVIDGGWTEFLEAYLPNVSLHQEPAGIFHRYHVYRQLTSALNRHISLPSGAHLVIDECEAMTVIDVNIGTALSSSRCLIHQTNLQAVHAIAQILILRQIGGLVAIDFIDMTDESQKHKIYQALKDALTQDVAKSSILPINEFGVMMVSRERRCLSLSYEYAHACPACRGVPTSAVSVACFGIIAELFDLSDDVSPKDTFILQVSPKLHMYLQTMPDYHAISQTLGATLQLNIMQNYDDDHHTLLKNKRR